MKKLLKWLLKKAYYEHMKIMSETVKTRDMQIKNLKERLKYAEREIQTYRQRDYNRR